MGNSTWVNTLDPFPTAVGAQFTTFTTNQDISPQPLPVIYGNELRVGSKIELEAIGEYGSTGTPTLILGFYITPSNLAAGIALPATAAARTVSTVWSTTVMQFMGISATWSASSALNLVRTHVFNAKITNQGKTA